MKKACVLRWGGYGDILMASILFPLLKKDGYHLTVHCKKSGSIVLKNNPHIDKIILHEGELEADKLQEYWDKLSVEYDKFVNLSESIERTLLRIPPDKEYWTTKEQRHRDCNVNYYDRTLKIAGYEHKNVSPEMYYSPIERQFAKKIRKKLKGKFVILWSLSGSSMHKSYPYTEYVLMELFRNYDDIEVLFVGDTVCSLLEFPHPRTHCYSGKWPIRKSLIMTEYVDCVIGPETGVLNCASGLDVPKIVFLSHSSVENLTKYWKNTTSLCAYDARCYPCHKMHYELETCNLDARIGTPVCMTKLKPKAVYDAIDSYYKAWRDSHNGTNVVNTTSKAEKTFRDSQNQAIHPY